MSTWGLEGAHHKTLVWKWKFCGFRKSQKRTLSKALSCCFIGLSTDNQKKMFILFFFSKVLSLLLWGLF